MTKKCPRCVNGYIAYTQIVGRKQSKGRIVCSKCNGTGRTDLKTLESILQNLYTEGYLCGVEGNDPNCNGTDIEFSEKSVQQWIKTKVDECAINDITRHNILCALGVE